MIELHIEEHCKNCPNFEVEQRTLYVRDIQADIVETKHSLRCKNEEVCKRIAEHLQENKSNI